MEHWSLGAQLLYLVCASATLWAIWFVGGWALGKLKDWADRNGYP